MKKLILTQFYLLLAGTIFAWSNFGRELYLWLNNESCQSCALTPMTNPFLTPCFYGAVMFLISFILAVKIKKQRHNISQL